MLKKLLIYHILPICTSFAIVYFAISFTFNSTNGSLREVTTSTENQTHNRGKYHNLSKKSYQVNYLAGLQSKDLITIFGSSEFSEAPLCSYHFLPDSVNIPALGIGHAGHQHFSIYSELLYGFDYLKDSKIVIMISPTWFDTEGTHPEAFLEFVNKNMLANIINNNAISDNYKASLGNYIAFNINSFDGVSQEMEALIDIDKMASKNPLSILTARLRNYMKKNFSKRYKIISEQYIPELIPFNKHSKNINYSEKMKTEQSDFISKTNNNNLFVDNHYFETYLLKPDGSIKTGSLNTVNPESNTEFSDFKKVTALLSEQEANATFVILPVNPYYYKNSKNYIPLIKALESEIVSRNFSVLNMYTSDTLSYEPGTLNDIMHLGNFGWLKVNRYINNFFSE